MQTQPTSQRRFHWWPPALIVFLGLATLAVLHWRETPFIEFIAIAIALLVVILTALWFIFFTGLRKSARWVTLGILVGALAGVVIALSLLTRIEGSIGGSGIPRLVWKWTPKREAAGALVMASAPASSSTPEPATNSPASQWSFPQFLGPNRNGIITNVVLDPDWLKSPPALRWRQPIGLGWSAFAVSGHLGVTQEQRGSNELVVCYDITSGKAIWAHTNQARFSEALGGDGPRATPTILGERVFTMGATGILNCLELPTGRLVWSRDVLGENQLSNPTWGKSCSPLLVEGLVVVTAGEQREKSLLAYRSESGEPAWHSGRDGASYSSPIYATLAGQLQIVVVNAHSVSAHHPADGRMLWDFEWPAQYAKVTQPIVIDTNHVFIAAGYGVGCVMLNVTRDGTGTWSAAALWKNRNLKPKFTNLVRRNNHVYGLDDGVLVCLDLQTGERAWKDGRYGHGQVLLVQDLLLIQAESGDVVLVDASPEQHQERARLKALKGKTWNNPVLVNNVLLVRNDQEAACYQLPVARTP